MISARPLEYTYEKNKKKQVPEKAKLEKFS